MKRIPLLSLLACFLVSVMLLASCASGRLSSSSATMNDEPYASDISFSPSEIEKETVIGGDGESLTENRKIIRNISLTLQTLAFDDGIAAIERSATALGGYVESSRIYGNSLVKTGSTRSAEYTIRVPASALDTYVNTLEEGFHVLRRSETATDVSEHYYDMQARLLSLQTQETRLLEMLGKADTLEELLLLEDKLSSVRYEIESYETSIKRYDSLIDYATITVSLQEVQDYTASSDDLSFGQQISNAFVTSWQVFVRTAKQCAIILVSLLPLLLFIAVLVVVVVVLCRSRKRKKKAMQENDLSSRNDTKE